MAFVQVYVAKDNRNALVKDLQYIKDGANLALTRALNESSNRAKTRGSQEIRKDVRLKAAYVKSKLKSAKDTPANKATFSRLQSKVSADSRGLLMSKFVTTGIGETPIKSRVKASGAITEWKSAFWLKLRQGKTQDGTLGVFIKRKKLGKRGGKFKAVYAPSVSQVFNEVREEIAPEMNDYFIERLNAQMLNIIKRNRR